MSAKKIVLKDGESLDVDVSKKIMLQSSDGECFKLDEAVARKMVTIAHMIDNECMDNAIPLAKITSRILAMVTEYCKKQVEMVDGGSSDEQLKAWDAEVVDVDQSTLFDLMLGAHFLNVKKLVDLTSQTVADMIKDKTPQEIRTTFNIKNDFTPEEEAEVCKQNKWVFR